MSLHTLNTSLGDVALYSPDNDIQPWNQADHYLLQQFDAHFTDQRLAIINDNYAALATALQAYSPVCYNDSAIYRYCLEQNLPQHTLPQRPVAALATAGETLFLLRLPKNLHFFRYQLSLLSAVPGSTVLVAGMQKYWPASFFHAAADYFDHVEVLPGIRKAKCMLLRNGKQLPEMDAIHPLSVPEFGLELCNFPNVFSREQLDIGSRFLLQNFPDLSSCNTVLDLACGNGVLGIYAQRKYPQLQAHYVDESAFAIRSCRLSLELNDITDDRYTLHHNHCLYGLSLHNLDAVLCNPPFHQQHHISDGTAALMIRQAAQSLSHQGKLFLIGNRHLPYYMQLKKHFRQIMMLAGNNKFVIYQASQPF